MIESWWRTLKHQWLFLNELGSVSALRRLINYYVEEYNARLPHSAFRGQTPDEMYFGTAPTFLLNSRPEGRRLGPLEWTRIGRGRVECVGKP